jgi:ATP-binding cassette subfamily B protein IrtA
MARGFHGAMVRLFGGKDHEATVTGKELLAPHFLRVRMTSPTLLDSAAVGPTAYVRFWFPDPAGGATEYQRAYTFSECSPETGEFAVDFVLHEPAGPATIWAEGAEPGDSVPVVSLGSKPFAVPDDAPDGYLLVGDAASTPAINDIVGVVPDDVPIELYLEVHDPRDELIAVAAHPKLVVHRVERGGAPSLALALAERDWSGWYAWAAPESGSLKHVRNRVLRAFGIPKTMFYQHAYWVEGRSMGKASTPAAG